MNHAARYNASFFAQQANWLQVTGYDQIRSEIETLGLGLSVTRAHR